MVHEFNMVSILISGSLGNIQNTKATLKESLSYEQDMVLSILRFGIEIVLIDYTTLHHISPTLPTNDVTSFKSTCITSKPHSHVTISHV